MVAYSKGEYQQEGASAAGVFGTQQNISKILRSTMGNHWGLRTTETQIHFFVKKTVPSAVRVSFPVSAVNTLL